MIRKTSINRRDFVNGCALSLAAGTSISPLDAIAQNLRSDVAGLTAVKQSLDRGISTVTVALSAGESISDLLLDLKAKAAAASDQGLDAASRSALNTDFIALRDQII